MCNVLLLLQDFFFYILWSGWCEHPLFISINQNFKKGHDRSGCDKTSCYYSFSPLYSCGVEKLYIYGFQCILSNVNWKSIFSVVVTSHTEPQCWWVGNTSQSFVVLLWNQADTGLFGLFCKERWQRDSGSPQSLQTLAVPDGFLRTSFGTTHCAPPIKGLLPDPLFSSLLLHWSPFLSFVFVAAHLSCVMLLILCLQSATFYVFILCFSFCLFPSIHIFFLFILFFGLAISLCRNLSAYASQPVPSCHIDWKCLVRGDVLSPSYPILSDAQYDASERVFSVSKSHCNLETCP